MNEIWMTINGNAADKPQLWENGERPFARVNVASTSRRNVNGEWQDGKTEWFQVKAWGAMAQNMAASIRKGDPVVVHGTYSLDEYTNDAGAVFKTAVIKASSVGFDLRRGCAMAVNRRAGAEEESAGTTEVDVEADARVDAEPGAQPDGGGGGQWPAVRGLGDADPVEMPEAV